MCRRLLCLSLVVLGIRTASADDAPAAPTVLSVSQAHAEACRVFPADHPDAPFVLHPKPILRRQQNTVGNSLGYTYIWLEASGRPAALCDIFYFKNHLDTRQMLNEWHSFADVPLTARGPGKDDIERDFMAAPKPGLEWSVIGDAPAPAATHGTRLVQLRRLIRRFAAEMYDRAEQHHDLRLLNTPIFDYESSDPQRGLGGAIYAFCIETDPECMLLIEARPVAGATSDQWMYAPVATSIDRQFLKLDGEQVWSADPPVFDAHSPHWKDFIKEVFIPVEKQAEPEVQGDSGARP